MKQTNSGELFAINIKMIRINKSVGPDRVPGEILKRRVEAMIPYLARLLDKTTNNAAIPSDWKRAIAVPIYKGRDRSVVTTTVQSA
jgi:hypothetical protein